MSWDSSGDGNNSYGIPAGMLLYLTALLFLCLVDSLRRRQNFCPFAGLYYMTAKTNCNVQVIHGVEWVTPASFSTVPTYFSGKYCSTTMVPFGRKRIRMATRRPVVVGSWTTGKAV